MYIVQYYDESETILSGEPPEMLKLERYSTEAEAAARAAELEDMYYNVVYVGPEAPEPIPDNLPLLIV